MSVRAGPRAPNGFPTIGLLLANIHTGASIPLWSGVAAEAARRGMNLVCFPGGRLEPAGSPGAATNAAYGLAGPSCLDGLLTWASSLGGAVPPEAVEGFHERYRDLPLVCLTQQVLGAPAVFIDAYRGMRAIIEHLVVAHGFRRIAFVRGPSSHPSAEDRFRAYRDALAAHGIPLDEALVTPPLAWDAGAESARVLLDERGLAPGSGFQAVAAASDLLALWLLRTLQSRGWVVPGDVAVTGFNDTAESRLASPQLTTAAMPFREQGRRAVDLLAALIEGRPLPASATLPSELVVRPSCGCPSAAVALAMAESGAAGAGASRAELVAALACRPGPVVAEMALASGLDEDAAAAWLEPLLHAFLGDLAVTGSGRFLATLDTALDRAVRSGVEVAPWQNAVSVLRHRVLGGLAPADRPAAEGLLEAARILVSDATAKERTWRQWHADRLAERVREVGTSLLTTLDTGQLLDRLAGALPGLGIPSAWLVLQDRDDGDARLVLACSGDERAALPASGLPFPASALLPAELLPRSRRYDLVVEPLHVRERRLGFAVFEIGPADGSVYEALRVYLSGALQGASLLREAREARAAAEKADLVKTRLLANVSHELRTPLDAILRRARTAREALEPGGSHASAEALRDHLAVISGNAEHQLRVINDLLDLSRAEINELDLDLELLDLRPLLEEAFASVAGPAGSAEVAWRLDLPERLPLVRADRVRLRQVVLNLLANARAFTRSGSVTLAAEAAPPFLEIRVEDTGPGIEAELRERIFEPFITAERGERPGGGIGLGLSIARHIATLHLGTLAVASEVGKGTTFRLRLPLPDLAGRVLGPEEPPEPVLVLVSASGTPAPEIAELSRRRGLAIVRLAPDEDAEQRLAGLRPAALAWDIGDASAEEWPLVRRLRHHPRLFQTPVILYGSRAAGAPVAGTTSLLDKSAARGTLLELIEAACPPQPAGPLLVVDDDPAMRSALVKLVAEGIPGLRTRQAADGRDALEAMEDEQPCLVVLDLAMPGIDGLAVLDSMRSSPRLRGVAVVVLTNRLLTAEDLHRIEAHARVTLQSKGVWSDAETLAAINRALFGRDELPPYTGALAKRAVAWLAANHARHVSRREIAEAVGASEDYLSRVFRRELGLSPWEYLNRYRVHRAAALLRDTGDGVKAIAARVGFRDPAYFSRVFHRLTGVSPQAWREHQ